MKVLLTDEEMVQAVYDICGASKLPIVQEESRAIAKAQLKKVVEWIKANEDNGGYKGLFYQCVPLKRWQALLKEVE